MAAQRGFVLASVQLALLAHGPLVASAHLIAVASIAAALVELLVLLLHYARVRKRGISTVESLLRCIVLLHGVGIYPAHHGLHVVALVLAHHHVWIHVVLWDLITIGLRVIFPGLAVDCGGLLLALMGD